MTEPQTLTGPAETAAVAAAVRAGDQATFASLAELHRRELLIHSYRMLGSFHDAEDAVQETFLRAWRYRDSLKEGAPLRPWLYRVATNACLDAIKRDPRRTGVAARADSPGADLTEIAEVTWLEPLPDLAVEPAAPRAAEPDSIVLTKETIELAFMTVIQLLTPEQRAVLLVRDLLGWSAREAAEMLEVSVASVNSALQRARATLQARLPAPKPAWPAGVDATAAERELLRKYVRASEKEDLAAFESIIREDAVFRMPPQPEVTVGREAMIRLWAEAGFGSGGLGRFRCLITRANLQPAVAAYTLREGESVYRPLALDVLRVEEGLITEIVTFPGDLFKDFGLPPTLSADS
jgi:RNA polymerase sigma-70 factor (ECF subfamily)